MREPRSAGQRNPWLLSGCTAGEILVGEAVPYLAKNVESSEIGEEAMQPQGLQFCEIRLDVAPRRITITGVELAERGEEVAKVLGSLLEQDIQIQGQYWSPLKLGGHSTHDEEVDSMAERTRRSPRNLTLCDSAMPELGEPVHPILQQLEPFERRQAEGPPNQGEIDSVRRLLRQEGRLVDVRLPGRLGHGNTIAQPPVRERWCGRGARRFSW